VAETGSVLGMIVPIEGGRADDIRVRQYWGVAVGRKILTRLKQQDAPSRISAQSRRKNRAGRAAAYNNDVEDLHDGLPRIACEKSSVVIFLG
jgi:hypothetical protein